MKKFAVVFAVAAITSLGIASALYVQQGMGGQSVQPAAVLFSSRWATFTRPMGATATDELNFALNLANGTSLPTLLSLDDYSGHVVAVQTGLILHTGERAVVVTVSDDITDIDNATLYLNGQLVSTATRANGGIVDRGTQGVATFSAFVHFATASSLEVRWVSNEGVELSESIHI